MEQNRQRRMRFRIRGVSLVETLLALGVMGVLFSFATSTLTHAAAKAELRAAAESLQHSIRMAKSTARTLDTGVVMHLNSNQPNRQNSVTFSLADERPASGSKSLPHDLRLPTSVKLIADVRSVRFDRRGTVEGATPVLLVSAQDDSINQGLVIE